MVHSGRYLEDKSAKRNSDSESLIIRFREEKRDSLFSRNTRGTIHVVF